MTAFAPTEEQLAALDAYATGEDLIIEAAAGAGKTATLQLLAESSPGRRGQYLAFNRAIVLEAQEKMPGHVSAATAHSLAFRAVGKRYAHRLNGPRMRSGEIARRLGLEPIAVMVGSDQKFLAEDYLAGLVMRGLEVFCQSADAEPAEGHFPYVDGIDLPEKDGKRGWRNNRELRRALLPFVRRAWEDVQRTDGQLPFRHGVYLKIYERSRPHIGVDVIFFDEAQDVSPVLASIVAQQTHAQLIHVGDSQQCQPAGTRVMAVSYPDAPYDRFHGTDHHEVPIENIRPGDVVVSYDISHAHLRRTGRRVRDVATRHYRGDLIRVTADGCSSLYTPNHRCVVRVADTFDDKWTVYLMRRGTSFRVGMCRGKHTATGGGIGAAARAGQERCDAAWLLSTHDSRESASAEELRVAWSYGIPTAVFREVHAPGALPQDDLDRFWDDLGDLTDRAQQCLSDHRLHLDLPMWNGRALYRNRAMVIHAANLRDGMFVLTMEGAMDAGGKEVAARRWSRCTVTREFYDGPVYSLDVEEDETYVADGIVTHNSIYGFTGAVDALAQLKAAGTRTTTLSQSFRFGDGIAEVANRVLATLPTAMRLRGTPSIASIAAPVAEPDAVLCRTNACAVRTLLDEAEAGRGAHLVGGGKEVIAFARAAEEMQTRGNTAHQDLACFESWGQVQSYVEEDAQGGELKLLVDLVDRFGARTITDALEAMPRERDADLVISTAHKSKGRQWASVRLAGDFPEKAPEPKSEGEPDQGIDERRLLYVAVTRARIELDAETVPWLVEGLTPDEDDEAGGECASEPIPMQVALLEAAGAA